MTSRIQHNNPQSSEALGLTYHYEMVSDSSRVTPFKNAINVTCKGKRVLESGTGSGILSILAAKAGAKKVYAVEIDSIVAKFARENIEKSGYGDIITLIEGDVKNVTLENLDGEKVDVVIAENLSTWQTTEPQIQVMNYINKNLIKSDGVRLPSVIFNQVELLETQFRFEDVIDLRTYFFEFTGIKKGKTLSKELLIDKVCLDILNPETIEKIVVIEVTKSGILNSVRLKSPLDVYEGILFESSDSLMPPVVFPLEEDIKVEAGDLIEIEFKYPKNTQWEDFSCRVRRTIGF